MTQNDTKKELVPVDAAGKELVFELDKILFSNGTVLLS